MNFKKLISSVLLFLGFMFGVTAPTYAAQTAQQTSISSTPSGFAVVAKPSAPVVSFAPAPTIPAFKPFVLPLYATPAVPMNYLIGPFTPFTPSFLVNGVRY